MAQPTEAMAKCDCSSGCGEPQSAITVKINGPPKQPSPAQQSQCCSPCPPCCVPVIAEGQTRYQVDPKCQPVCVPIVTQAVCPPPKPRKKRCRYIQPARPKSYAPQRKYAPPASKMDDGTVYRKSYLPTESDRPDAIRPENNLCVGEGKMSDNTVHNMSYMPHDGILPPCPIYPCEHRLLGEGPMQDLTTQKHDYVPKPFSRPDAIRPIVNLFSSDCPLSDKTVNRLSYMPVDMDKAHKPDPFLPLNAIEKPSGKISDKTIHGMSYRPWQPPEPPEMPWANKAKYQPPKLRMDGSTVQKMSYMPPGQYVECADGDDGADCFECPEEPCTVADPHTQPGYTCCGPCCCPRAAC